MNINRFVEFSQWLPMAFILAKGMFAFYSMKPIAEAQAKYREFVRGENVTMGVIHRTQEVLDGAKGMIQTRIVALVMVMLSSVVWGVGLRLRYPEDPLWMAIIFPLTLILLQLMDMVEMLKLLNLRKMLHIATAELEMLEHLNVAIRSVDFNQAGSPEEVIELLNRKLAEVDDRIEVVEVERKEGGDSTN